MSAAADLNTHAAADRLSPPLPRTEGALRKYSSRQNKAQTMHRRPPAKEHRSAREALCDKPVNCCAQCNNGTVFIPTKEILCAFHLPDIFSIADFCFICQEFTRKSNIFSSFCNKKIRQESIYLKVLSGVTVGSSQKYLKSFSAILEVMFQYEKFPFITAVWMNSRNIKPSYAIKNRHTKLFWKRLTSGLRCPRSPCCPPPVCGSSAPLRKHTFFVPSEHPDFNVCFRKSGNGFWNAILQFVFNGCGPEQLQHISNTAI